ncbi:MAG: helix-turn-helix domain-containing protein [Terrisporobacter sp.]|uniref:helix-turn-helix domain-containing protein n=1 Tax=Terrisporobacter sp. TaxID=1965305 RepID=UPI002FC82084
MNYNTNIGLKIKELRTQKKFTLKYVSEQTNLSTGFLSQLERGMTSVAVDSLAKIAKVLDVDLLEFFDFASNSDTKNITRSYERKSTTVNDELIQYTLNNNPSAYEMLPRIQELMPSKDEDHEELELYFHEGEEFIHVLEGILTLNIDNIEYSLYPGDSAQIKSVSPHNWMNKTSKVVKILTVNTPNPFKS